jgi:hypothetical protein
MMAVQRKDVLDARTVEHGPLDYGLAPGGQLQELTNDDETLATHAILTFPAGWRDDRRGYFTAGMDVYVLAGDLTVGNAALSRSSYSYFPAGVAAGPFSTAEGCRLLVFNGGAQSFVASDASLPDADESAYVANNVTYMQPWMDPMKDIVKKVTWKDPETGAPARPAGIFTKTLRRDERTKELVALTAQVSGFIDPGTEVHPHNECLYLIAGDAYIGTTYDNKRELVQNDIVLTADHYISRHPGIYHGPVATQNGTLWLIHLSDGYTGIFGEVPEWQEQVSTYLAGAEFR